MSRSCSHTIYACLLLILFVMGSVAAPLIHRIEHGLTWAALRGDTPTACDHSEHGVRFEASIPSFHKDLCLLCERSFEGKVPVAVTVVQGLERASFVPSSFVQLYYRPTSALLIRGPPQTV